MISEQDEKLAEIGRQIQKLLPDMFGSVRFNLRPGRDYVNINFEQGKAFEFDGTVITNIGKRVGRPYPIE